MRVKTKADSEQTIKRKMIKKTVNFKILYRKLNYLEQIKDSIGFDITNFNIFNSEGFKLDLMQVSGGMACSDEMKYQVISRLQPSLKDIHLTTLKIDTLLDCLEDIDGKSIKLPINFDYFVVSDWSTYMIGRQRRLLKKWNYLLKDSSICFILVNKDYFLNDTITDIIKSKIKIKTNFKY